MNAERTIKADEAASGGGETQARATAARQTVRMTAGKVLRSEDLAVGEKEIAAAILRANPELGNPHIVRCNWCRQTRMLFRDENDGPFHRAARGWRCETCDVSTASQEVRF